jgi:hypothetical protein
VTAGAVRKGFVVQQQVVFISFTFSESLAPPMGIRSRSVSMLQRPPRATFRATTLALLDFPEPGPPVTTRSALWLGAAFTQHSRGLFQSKDSPLMGPIPFSVPSS